MRFLSPSILALAFLVNLPTKVQAQANDAEQLYIKMVETVIGAENLQISIKAEGKSNGKVTRTLQGKFVMESPNSLYVKLDGNYQGKPDSTLMVCDGTNMKVGDKPARAATADASDNWRGFLVSMGLSTYLSTGLVRGAPKLDNKEYKLGKKENVNGVEAQAIEYAIDLGKPEVTLTTTVWVDPKTNLPVKRITVVKVGKDEGVYSESLGPIKMNEKIDPKTFAIPK